MINVDVLFNILILLNTILLTIIGYLKPKMTDVKIKKL